MPAPKQVVIFTLVGLFCATVDVGIMQFLIAMDANHLSATTGGFLVGLTANYLLHSQMTFRVVLGWKVLLRFLTVVAINYAVTLVLVNTSFYVLGSPLLGKLFSLPLVAINGYLLSKVWVFR